MQAEVFCERKHILSENLAVTCSGRFAMLIVTLCLQLMLQQLVWRRGCTF